MTTKRLTEARRAVHEYLVILAAPEADRVRDLIAELEEAVRDDALNPEVCEFPHGTIEEEDACERLRVLSFGSAEISKKAKSRYSEEYLRKINQGMRRPPWGSVTE